MHRRFIEGCVRRLLKQAKGNPGQKGHGTVKNHGDTEIKRTLCEHFRFIKKRIRRTVFSLSDAGFFFIVWKTSFPCDKKYSARMRTRRKNVPRHIPFPSSAKFRKSQYSRYFHTACLQADEPGWAARKGLRSCPCGKEAQTKARCRHRAHR